MYLIKKIISWQVITLLGCVGLQFVFPVELYAEEVLSAVLTQDSRPTVQQVLDLMNHEKWNPDPLIDEINLPKDPTKAKDTPELQNNFPVWFDQLIQGAPRMIATFERAFPGATWAFIGRDTAILADAFEAFYLSLGQKDRVVRIEMSSDTLTSINNELIRKLLESKGVQMSEPSRHKTPFILVDAVSRGGGRQGRSIINAAYKHFAKKRIYPYDLCWYFNYIGLVVSTSPADLKLDVSDPYSALQVQTEGYRKLLNNEYVINGLFIDNTIYYSVIDYFLFHPIIAYADGRAANSYLGVNESGYTHWTGAWHGPFGQMQIDETGFHLAKPQYPMSLEVRKAVLRFQAHVIRKVMEPEFLNQVKSEAKALHYSFPLKRPHYVPHPIEHFLVDLKRMKSLDELESLVERFLIYNYGRVRSTALAFFLLEEMKSRKELYDLQKFMRMFHDQQSLFERDYQKSLKKMLRECLKNTKFVDNLLSQENLNRFFDQKPTYSEVDKLLKLVKNDKHMNCKIVKRALKEVSSSEKEKLLSEHPECLPLWKPKRWVKKIGNWILPEHLPENSEL